MHFFLSHGSSYCMDISKLIADCWTFINDMLFIVFVYIVFEKRSRISKSTTTGHPKVLPPASFVNFGMVLVFLDVKNIAVIYNVSSFFSRKTASCKVPAKESSHNCQQIMIMAVPGILCLWELDETWLEKYDFFVLKNLVFFRGNKLWVHSPILLWFYHQHMLAGKSIFAHYKWMVCNILQLLNF